MNETILCDNCNEIFNIDYNDDYYEHSQEETFEIFKCPHCGKPNAITWMQSISIHNHIATKEELKEFDVQEVEE